MRVYIDGTGRASETLACDYTYAIPCSTESTGRTLSVNLAATTGGSRLIPDGAHSVQVAAIDAAGNETRSTARSIVVDATAPVAPSDLASSVGSSWQPSREFNVTWTQPTGQVAPIDTAHWSFCPQGTSTGCITGSAPVSASTGILGGLQVPAEGEWDFSLRLQDAAGNTAAANVARTVVRYDATAPDAPTNFAVQPRPETASNLAVYFRPPTEVQRAPVTHAQWALCPQDVRSACITGTTPLSPDSGTFVRTTMPRYGEWTLTVRLPDEAGNLGSPAVATARYTAPAPAPAPAPPWTSAPPPAPTATPAPQRAGTHLRLLSALVDRSRGTLTVKGTIAAKATGTVRLTIRVARQGRTRTIIKTVAIRNGAFGTRRTLSRADARSRVSVAAAYRGSATHQPATTPRRSATPRRR